MRIAYVSAEYPKVSHTFILREVEGLRRAGAEIDTVSVRRTPDEQLYSAADRREAARTFAILPAAGGRLLRAHVGWATRAPRRYARTLGLALRGSPPGAKARLWQLFHFAEAGLLADEVRARGDDHVHAHFVNVAATVAWLSAELAGRPWSFTMHGPLDFDEVERHRIAEKVARARLVVCISDFARAQLMRLVDPVHWDKLHVVHCGVLPSEYGPPRTPSGTFEIASVGRLAPMKGFGILLEALAALRRDGVDARLTLAGDGPQRSALEAAARRLGIADSVTFAGALGADEVSALLRRADVFCLPSFAEGVPVVLMEAMASRLPVVATAVMGVPELVRSGESGLLVPPGRAEPLAAALGELAADPELRERMGAAGRATVKAEFDVERSATALLALFEGRGAVTPAAVEPAPAAVRAP
jgi:glycosyltransferase involved in cell wall biosynthesis